MVEWVGDLGYFSRRVIEVIVTRTVEGAEFLRQLDAIGAKSLRWQHSRALPLIQSRRVPQCFSVINPNLLNRVISEAARPATRPALPRLSTGPLPIEI